MNSASELPKLSYCPYDGRRQYRFKLQSLRLLTEAEVKYIGFNTPPLGAFLKNNIFAKLFSKAFPIPRMLASR